EANGEPINDCRQPHDERQHGRAEYRRPGADRLLGWPRTDHHEQDAAGEQEQKPYKSRDGLRAVVLRSADGYPTHRTGATWSAARGENNQQHSEYGPTLSRRRLFQCLGIDVTRFTMRTLHPRLPVVRRQLERAAACTADEAL